MLRRYNIITTDGMPAIACEWDKMIRRAMPRATVLKFAWAKIEQTLYSRLSPQMVILTQEYPFIGIVGVIAAAVLLQRRCPRSAREHMVPTPAQLKNDKQNM